MSIPATITATFSTAARRRIVLVLTALALALTTLISPALTTTADAATAPKLTAKVTAQYAKSMLGAMNVERKWHHKKALKMNVKLIKSAHAHNLSMARANAMSHQLPGEAFFADRISKAGYNWQSAGENIGWNSDLTKNGIFYLQRVMYNEKAPNDGHRVNILSSTYTEVGIDVYFDVKHNKVWFTQDFGQPMR